METTYIMATQLELINLDLDDPIVLSDIVPGNLCKIIATGKIVMRVKVTGFLLNSNIVADVLNRGDVFVVDVSKGTLYATVGDTPVSHVYNTKLQYSLSSGR